MEEEVKTCPHGREEGTPCPHCLGLNEGKTIDVPVEGPKEPEPVDFIQHLVAPHGVKSVVVTQDDIPQLIEDAKILYNLCFTQVGLYPGAYAMAHPQINDKRPLRFFVTAEAKVVINPKIINHTNYYVDKEEACMSFPDRKKITVPRFHKITLTCQTIRDDNGNVVLTEPEEISLSGMDAEVIEHELDHLNGHYIYDESWTPEACLED